MTKITATVMEQSTFFPSEVREENKDLIEFGKSIDFAPLFQAVSTKLGLVDTLGCTTLCIKHRNRRFYIDCESENLIGKAGVLASVFDKVAVTFFSNEIGWDEENKRYAFWACVNVSWQHISGGSNGTQLATVWFNEETGWTFKFIEPEINWGSACLL